VGKTLEIIPEMRQAQMWAVALCGCDPDPFSLAEEVYSAMRPLEPSLAKGACRARAAGPWKPSRDPFKKS
jgi:hypothetical protein